LHSIIFPPEKTSENQKAFLRIIQDQGCLQAFSLTSIHSIRAFLKYEFQKAAFFTLSAIFFPLNSPQLKSRRVRHSCLTRIIKMSGPPDFFPVYDGVKNKESF